VDRDAQSVAAGKGAAPRDAISLSNLSVEFNAGTAAAVLAVEKVSFSLRAGEFVALVGPSGSGKTTILDAIAGLLPVRSRGRIDVFGAAPAAGNPNIAYMLVRDSLLPWQTTLENAAYGMKIRGVPRAERERRALMLLERVGLKDFLNSYPKALSQGMRQRCALARTFALESPVYLMDEPFGALDAQTKLGLESTLTDLWRASGTTVIFVTHDLNEAIALSDRIIVMSARPGRIVADIPVDLPRPRRTGAVERTLRFNEFYAQLWSLLESVTGDVEA
jgi:NitT/TauT family transport system ATP-binding protein